MSKPKENGNGKLRSFTISGDRRQILYTALINTPSDPQQGFKPGEAENSFKIVLKVVNKGWDDVNWEPDIKKIDVDQPIELTNSEWEIALNALRGSKFTNLIAATKCSYLIKQIKEIPLK